MKKYLLLLTGIAAAGFSFAQDIHFSQYLETPSLINPALTGSQYVMRASVNYKDQWGSITTPYRTLGASYEMKFKASNWEKTDPFKTKTYKKAFSRMAGGLSFFSDKAGDGQLGTTQVNLSLASFIKTGVNSTLSLGLQGGIVQKSVNFSKFIFSNQYNGTTYDPNIDNGELEGSRKVLYPDVSAGVLWNYNKEESTIALNDQLNANVGVAMFHINKPRDNFMGGADDHLDSKYVVHGMMLVGIPHTSLGIVPSFMCEFQGKQKELLAGAMVRYYLKYDSKYTGYVKRSSFSLGAYYRNKDAAIVSALFELASYAIGISYDINTSGLSKISTLRGGPEITLRYNSANRFLFQKRKS